MEKNDIIGFIYFLIPVIIAFLPNKVRTKVFYGFGTYFNKYFRHVILALAIVLQIYIIYTNYSFNKFYLFTINIAMLTLVVSIVISQFITTKYHRLHSKSIDLLHNSMLKDMELRLELIKKDKAFLQSFAEHDKELLAKLVELAHCAGTETAQQATKPNTNENYK